MPKLMLDRQTLARFLPNSESIRVFEQVMKDVGGTLPSTIEEAHALAGQALAAAQVALASLSVLVEALDQLEGLPALVPQVDPDDTAPRVHLGTVSSQNADQVEITGGKIDNTPIGATTAAAGKFTTLTASEQITSTVAAGTAPLVVTSTTKVANLAVETADKLANPTTYPANATDLPSVIALANALKAANTAKGV